MQTSVQSYLCRLASRAIYADLEESRAIYADLEESRAIYADLESRAIYADLEESRAIYADYSLELSMQTQFLKRGIKAPLERLEGWLAGSLMASLSDESAGCRLQVRPVGPERAIIQAARVRHVNHGEMEVPSGMGTKYFQSA